MSSSCVKWAQGELSRAAACFGDRLPVGVANICREAAAKKTNVLLCAWWSKLLFELFLSLHRYLSNHTTIWLNTISILGQCEIRLSLCGLKCARRKQLALGKTTESSLAHCLPSSISLRHVVDEFTTWSHHYLSQLLD